MSTRILDLERLFKALADGTRLRILGLLLTGEVCVCHIHETLKISQPKASLTAAATIAIGAAVYHFWFAEKAAVGNAD